MLLFEIKFKTATGEYIHSVMANNIIDAIKSIEDIEVPLTDNIYKIVVKESR